MTFTALETAVMSRKVRYRREMTDSSDDSLNRCSALIRTGQVPAVTLTVIEFDV